MPRVIRCSLIQAANVAPVDRPLEEVKRVFLKKNLETFDFYFAAGSFQHYQLTAAVDISFHF